MHDLVVHDDYYQELETYFVTKYNDIQEIVKSYIDIMENVVNEGIIEGETAKSVKEFNLQLKRELSSKENLSQIGKTAKRYCRNFVK